MASQIIKEYERGNISKVNGLFVKPAVWLLEDFPLLLQPLQNQS